MMRWVVEHVIEFFRPRKPVEDQRVRDASHALNNAAAINQGKRLELRKGIDALSELVNDMQRQRRH
jgi:hypothetical protein